LTRVRVIFEVALGHFQPLPPLFIQCIHDYDDPKASAAARLSEELLGIIYLRHAQQQDCRLRSTSKCKEDSQLGK
jgi:hypothetical protein